MGILTSCGPRRPNTGAAWAACSILGNMLTASAKPGSRSPKRVRNSSSSNWICSSKSDFTTRPPAPACSSLLMLSMDFDKEQDPTTIGLARGRPCTWFVGLPCCSPMRKRCLLLGGPRIRHPAYPRQGLGKRSFCGLGPHSYALMLAAARRCRVAAAVFPHVWLRPCFNAPIDPTVTEPPAQPQNSEESKP